MTEKKTILIIEDDKGILYSKLLRALNPGLSLSLVLTEPLKEVPLDSLSLSRILIILFSILNSTPPLSTPVSRLYEKGYTTKEQHDGLGLYMVRNMVDSCKHANLITQYDALFHQTLEIRRDMDK